MTRSEKCFGTIRESPWTQQPPVFSHKNRRAKGRACGARRSVFPLDILICWEVFAAVAIDGGMRPKLFVEPKIRCSYDERLRSDRYATLLPRVPRQPGRSKHGPRSPRADRK